MQIQFEAFAAKMRDDGRSPQRIQLFLDQLRAFAGGESGLLPEEAIDPVSTLPQASQLPAGVAPWEKTVVIKLNGGLGTSMGLAGPKSLLPIRDNANFLDITLRQLTALREKSGVSVPLILMNSAHTSEATRQHLQQRGADGVLELLQSTVPKIGAQGQPADWPDDPGQEWCPPGHGDLYPSLLESGLLERLLDLGIDYAFVSNVDNLGATLDEKILAWFAHSGSPFAMEVTRRTAADRKGGHLAQNQQGLLLREVAQCPTSDLDAFQNIERHRYFNTNNLWLNLRRLAPLLAGLRLPLIVNRKNLVPCDRQSPPVIQLETAMGAALSVVPGSQALEVTRDRFVPVKKTSDLLVLRSDVFEFDARGHLSQTSPQLPLVELDERYFGHLADFEERVPHPLGLRRCRRLIVKGDVSLAELSSLQGEVLLEPLPGKSGRSPHPVEPQLVAQAVVETGE